MSEEARQQVNDSEIAKLFRTRMDIFVLNALNERNGAGYGYDVINYIQEHTHGHYKIKSLSTIYNILKRLEAQGFVVSQKGGNETNGGIRVYYTLTENGKAYLEQDKKEWIYIRTLLDGLVSDDDFDLDVEEPPYSASVLKPLTKRNRDNGEEASEPFSESEEIEAEPTVTVFTVEETEDIPLPEPVLESSAVDIPPLEAPRLTMTVPDTENAVVSPVNTISAPLLTTPVSAVVSENETVSTRAVGLEAATDSVSVSVSTSVNPVGVENKPVQPSVTPLRVQADTVPAEEVVAESSVSDATAQPSFTAPKKPFVPKTEAEYMESFRKSLESEGIGLFAFDSTQKADTIAYFKVRRVVRDTSFAAMLYLTVLLLGLFIWKDLFAFSLLYVHVFAGIGFSGVVVCFFMWLQAPQKRRKCVINLKLLNTVMILCFVGVSLLSVAILLFLPNGYGLTSAPLYVPSVLATIFPFCGIVYSLLYKSGNYSK